MTYQCPASGTRAWFKGRPPCPPDATNQQILDWDYAELLCDLCGRWVPAAECQGLVIPEQVLSTHAPGGQTVTIHESLEPVFRASCDGCNALFNPDSESHGSFWLNREHVLDWLTGYDSGWTIDGDRHLCPECTTLDEDGLL